MNLIRKRACARAGLVGNPSDGYGGKTISAAVRNFWAEVVLYEWDTLDIVLAGDDRARFASIQDLAKDVKLHGYYGGIRLVKATIKRFVDYCQGRGLQLHIATSPSVTRPMCRARWEWPAPAPSSSPPCAA